MISLQIKELLQKKNKSRYWLVQATESSYSAVNKLVNNDTTRIRFDTLNRLCKALECNVGDIIQYTKDS